MSSAAEVFGERLIAVVLTGTGSDGTEGARLVKGAGGTVVIQDPETAELGGMPGSLASNTVDIVAPLHRIGSLLGDLVTGIEVAEGKPEAEEQRARLETILRQMPGGVFIADLSGRITLTNEGAKRIYRKTMASVEECREHSLSYPEGAEIPWRNHPLVRALEGESVTGMEHYVLRADGTRGVVRVNAAPVRDEEGRVVAAVKALDDVTAQKEAEAALGETEERLRTVVEGTPSWSSSPWTTRASTISRRAGGSMRWDSSRTRWRGVRSSSFSPTSRRSWRRRCARWPGRRSSRT